MFFIPFRKRNKMESAEALFKKKGKRIIRRLNDSDFCLKCGKETQSEMRELDPITRCLLKSGEYAITLSNGFRYKRGLCGVCGTERFSWVPNVGECPL